MKCDIVNCWVASLLRVYPCGLALITGYIGMTDERSLFYLVASTNGGYLLLWALIGLSIIGLFDVVINDWLPEKIKWDAARSFRHFLFSSMAFCYVAQVFIAHHAVGSPGLTAYYLLNALAIMQVVFIDAYQRLKEATACKLIC